MDPEVQRKLNAVHVLANKTFKIELESNGLNAKTNEHIDLPEQYVGIPYLAILTAYKELALERLLNSIDVPVQRLCIILNKLQSRLEGHAKIRKLVTRYNSTNAYMSRRIHLLDMDYNGGFSHSTNIVLKHIAEQRLPWGLIMEDDGEFKQGAIAKLVTHMNDSKNKDLIVLLDPGKAAAGFIVRPEFVSRVGYFDENIYPAYAEDCDMFLRIRELGLPIDWNPKPWTPKWDKGLATTTEALFDEGANSRVSSALNHCYFQKKWNLTQACSLSCDKVEPCRHHMYTVPFNNSMRSMKSWDPNLKLLQHHMEYVWHEPRAEQALATYSAREPNGSQAHMAHERRLRTDVAGKATNCVLPGF